MQGNLLFRSPALQRADEGSRLSTIDSKCVLILVSHSKLAGFDQSLMLPDEIDDMPRVFG